MEKISHDLFKFIVNDTDENLPSQGIPSSICKTPKTKNYDYVFDKINLRNDRIDKNLIKFNE